MRKRTRRNGIIKIILSIIIVLILLIGAFYFWKAQNILIITNGVNDEYQAIFLDNGQIYFGKVSNKESTYVTLTNIYYLQFQQPLQNQGSEDGSQQSDLKLIKLGGELHGPKDEMEILRSHILFIETLADNSRVVRAILEHKNNE